jgi:hypothetical protein
MKWYRKFAATAFLAMVTAVIIGTTIAQAAPVRDP